MIAILGVCMSRMVLILILLINSFAIQAENPLGFQHYASLPEKSLMALSPDGSLIAYRQTSNKRDIVVVKELASNKVISAVDVSAVLPNNLFLVNNELLILKASDNKRILGYRGRHDLSVAYGYNLKTKKIWQLMTQGYGITDGQTNVGKILGISEDNTTAYMPAYDSNGRYNLYRVSLKKRRKPKLHMKGTHDAIDFFLHQGEALVRERYNNKTNLHRLEVRRDGKWQEIFRETTDFITKSFRGLTADLSAIIMVKMNTDTGRDAFYKLSIADGSISEPLFNHSDKDVESLIISNQQKVMGVSYSGFKPSYEFFDNKLNARMRGIAKAMPNNAFSIEDYSDDWDHILFLMEGQQSAGMYIKYFDGGLDLVDLVRPQIPDEMVNDVTPYAYKARDGRNIPSLLTLPVGKTSDAKKLPAIMMPHGGPESYDRIGFDYLAQYFANKGFAVIQPQFRGSEGFGLDHLLAGRGKWGREMQDDLTDAVLDLVKKGTVDKDRVCIVGASYGGYAALAGATFTPDLYQCIVAINGVSDIPRMLSDGKREMGSEHWVISYWNAVIANGGLGKEHLKTISPINHVKAVKKPILLIHGEYDEVVSVKQSKIMRDALEDEDKSVEYIELEKGNHYLSRGENRMKALEVIDAFIDKHIPL